LALIHDACDQIRESGYKFTGRFDPVFSRRHGRASIEARLMRDEHKNYRARTAKEQQNNPDRPEK
jgi:hypothetical protein